MNTPRHTVVTAGCTMNVATTNGISPSRTPGKGARTATARSLVGFGRRPRGRCEPGAVLVTPRDDIPLRRQCPAWKDLGPSSEERTLMVQRDAWCLREIPGYLPRAGGHMPSNVEQPFPQITCYPGWALRQDVRSDRRYEQRRAAQVSRPRG